MVLFRCRLFYWKRLLCAYVLLLGLLWLFHFLPSRLFSSRQFHLLDSSLLLYICSVLVLFWVDHQWVPTCFFTLYITGIYSSFFDRLRLKGQFFLFPYFWIHRHHHYWRFVLLADLLFRKFASIRLVSFVWWVGMMSGVTCSHHDSLWFGLMLLVNPSKCRRLICEVLVLCSLFNFATELDLSHEAVIGRLNHVWRSFCLPSSPFIDVSILLLPFVGIFLSVSFLESI